MPTLTLDVALFSVFLAINLIVGLSYGRSVKDFKDYALGGKNFSTATLVATIIATWYGGGSLFRTLEKTYSSGLYYIIALLGISIGLLLNGQLAVRMREFLNNVSVAEAMGGMYGKTARMITAMSGIMAKTGAVAIQFKVISTMLSILFNLESASATFIAASIVIVYSAFGGIRAVTFTDVLQFFTFGTIIPVLALTIWTSLQDHTQVFATLTNYPMFDFKTVVGWTPQFMSTLTLLFFFVMPGYAPELFQRIAMAKNVTQAKNSLTYAAGIALLINLLLSWVGILLLVDNPGLEPSQVVACMINKYAGTGLRGLIGIGITALAMSTADSCLNACSVLFANDIVKPLTRQDNSSVITARAFSLVIGIGALLLALYSKDLLAILLLSGSFYMPIFTIPMLLAILGFRSTTKAVLIGMVAGFLTVVLWSIFLNNAGSIVPGMLANLIGLLGSHYLLREKGGWKKAAPNSPLALARQERKKAWKERKQALRSFKPYAYLQQNLPPQEYFYFLFGLYTIVATYAAFYTIGDAEIKGYQDIYEGIYHTVLFATTAFLTFPIWPPTVKSKHFITLFWPVGICAILFFAGTLLVIMSHFHILQVMILMINLLVAVLLLHWPLAMLLAATGSLLAILFFKQYTGLPLPASALGSLQLKIIYGLLLFSSFLIALFKGKQAYQKLEQRKDALVKTNQETQETLLEAFKEKARLIKTLRLAGIQDLSRIAKLLKELRTQDQAASGGQSPLTGIIQQLVDKVTPMAVELTKIENRATDYLRLAVDTVSIDQLLDQVQEKLRKQDLDQDIHWHTPTQHQELCCDVARIKTLLLHGITVLRTATAQEHPIQVALEDTQLAYALPSVSKDYTKQIPALRLSITTQSAPPVLAQSYPAQMHSTSPPMPEAAQELPLIANQRIVKAHYGYARVTNDTQVYVIPVQLREVRPKDTDQPYMELGAELTRADDTYPGAAAQESAFLAAVQQKTRADISLVKTALEAIKWYHGPVRRKSGEPFYLHPLAVAHIVLDYNQDEATILGALLHDTVEDTPMLLENIETMFGQAVVGIVAGVTHLESNQDSFYKIKLSSQENMQMLLGVADQRALYVKIADRMHNMRTIQYKPYKSQQRTSEETLQFFVPLAEQLGLQGAVAELKELCLAVLHKKQ